MDISEKNLEETIEQVLLSRPPPVQSTSQGIHLPSPLYGPGTSNLTPDDVAPGGYCKHLSEEYDKALCLIPEDVLNFVYATQPKEWDKFKKQHEGDAMTPFLQRLSSELRARGTLPVLRKGIKANGCRFQLAYFIPSSGLNYDLLSLYEANLFSEVRQLHYSERNNNSLDLVWFLNGLPIFTAELKNPFKTKATLLLKSFVDRHEQTIAKKVAIIVEHFAGQVAHQIDGKAKAMIVTRSRLHAVRSKHAVDRYLKEHGYAYKALVAFSGTVHEKGIDYTESNMNGFSDTKTAEIFKQDLYRILIVANKFQTGFDQRLAYNTALEASVRVNPPENGRLTFDLVVNDLLQDMIDGHFKFYKHVTDDPDFTKTLLDLLFERYLGRAGK